MGPVGFLQGLWSPGGSDVRQNSGENGSSSNFTFGPSTAVAPQPRQSLLSEQRSPVSPLRPTPNGGLAQSRPAVSAKGRAGSGDIDLTSHLVPPSFPRVADPSSPSARALSEHAPGQSLPGGVATALSRLHLQGVVEETLRAGQDVRKGEEERREEGEKGDEGEEEMFAMDG